MQKPSATVVNFCNARHVLTILWRIEENLKEFVVIAGQTAGRGMIMQLQRCIENIIKLKSFDFSKDHHIDKVRNIIKVNTGINISREDLKKLHKSYVDDYVKKVMGNKRKQDAKRTVSQPSLLDHV